MIIRTVSLNFATALLIFLAPCLKAQNLFTPYYPDLVLNTEYPEVNPVISVDGRTLFFSRVNHPENRFGRKDSQDIWYISLHDDGTWSEAQRLPESVNIGRYNAILSALDNGRSYFVLGRFNKRGTLRTSNGFSIIEKTGDSIWSIPQPLKVDRYKKMSRGKVGTAYMTPDRELIIHSFSTRHNRDKISLYVSRHDGENSYSKPEKIVIGRFDGREARSLEAPFLNEDKSRLFFSGNFDRDPSDRYDIYFIDKVDNTYLNWSAPVRVSDTINGPRWDSYFKMNADESLAWYSSTSGTPGGAGIFMINLIEEFPFVEVSGRVTDVRTGKPVSVSHHAEVLINGELSDSVEFDRISGSFSVLLPLGVRYTLAAKADNYTSTPVIVDVTGEESFIEREVDLYLESVPWVELSGQVLDNRSLEPLSPDEKPVLTINGSLADSVSIDPASGKYMVKLPFGRDYILGVAAGNYKALEVRVDLTEYEEYADLTQNILAERQDINMVTLNGRVINTKTGKYLEEGYHVRMMVNGVESKAFDYEGTTASYTLKLPVGFNYDLEPMLFNFYNRLESVNLTDAEPMSRITRNFYVTPLEVGQSVEIENIYFETGKAVLKPESFRSLNALIEFLREYPNVIVEIGGHTDNIGSAVVNQRISEERAFAVADYVISQGIGAYRVVSKGYGFSKPIASNLTEEGRTRNRRVDFTITGL